MFPSDLGGEEEAILNSHCLYPLFLLLLSYNQKHVQYIIY